MADVIDIITSAKKAKDALSSTMEYLNKAKTISTRIKRAAVLGQLAETGKRSLEAATPRDTGKTASSWGYTIEDDGRGKVTVAWTNSNVVDGVNIAVILQYGHGTRNGGYVQGIDYVNPAMRPIMTQMADEMWKAVVSL